MSRDGLLLTQRNQTPAIDRLKIDQSFVRDIPGDASDVAIVEAIVSLSRTLGLRVIVEGVETEAQLGVLRRLGCEEGQVICSAGPCLSYKTSRAGNGRGRSFRGGEVRAGARTGKSTRFRNGKRCALSPATTDPAPPPQSNIRQAFRHVTVSPSPRGMAPPD